MTRRTRRAGVTLIEILVTIAVAGAMLGLLLPAIQRIRSSADRAVCANRLRQIALAAHAHHDGVGRFPSGITRGLNE